jgi:hypothetical protein
MGLGRTTTIVANNMFKYKSSKSQSKHKFVVCVVLSGMTVAWLLVLLA